ncbi:MAG: MATE family efflux transporter [Oscillospiraceae bacterium]|nr:MATE family efflux transporter [Oscillospiraceae bacterium]
MRHQNVNMLSGSITKGLLGLTFPIMIVNVAQALFSIADMTVLRVFADDSAVGAVGSCTMLTALCINLLVGISVGANVVTARHLGAGSKERAAAATTTALVFSAFGSLVLAVIGLVFAETFLRWTNCPQALLPGAVLYFRLYFAGCPAIMLYNFCSALLRASGETKKPMYFLILGGICKLLVNLFCSAVLDIGVAGVGIATILSYLIAGVLCFLTILHQHDVFHLYFPHFSFHVTELKEMLRVGIPAGIQNSLYALANVVITATVNSFGEHAATGVSIANQFDNLLYQVSIATSLAVTPYVSQNVGAGNFKRVRQALLRAVLITTAFGAGLGALSAIFSGSLSSIMSGNPDVIRFSQQKMVIVSSTYFICGICETLVGTLRGIGRNTIPTVATFVFMCLLRLAWVEWVFPLCPPDLSFLYLVWPVGWVACIITYLIVFFPAISKLQRRQFATQT